MKNKIFYLSTFIFLFFTFNNHAQTTITRGAEENEIYISTIWYMDNLGMHKAIFHSTDNGENITLKYENIETPPAGEMKAGIILGDATPGVLYNYGYSELWVSFDFGKNWEYREDCSYANYATGFLNGEIYRRSNYNLYKSDDYGETFELIVEELTEPLTDVGYQAGELFGFTGSSGNGYKLYHSIDYGQTYTETLIDSAVAFWSPSGHYPKISRGTEAGEIYLVSWWVNSNYKIFHSVDTGYTWTEKFESEYIDVYYWQLVYTAGRESGSFYVMRSTFDPTFNHRLLYIDYSNDYGETFTTFFHEIDSTISSVNSIKKKAFNLTCYPNPVTDQINIEIDPTWQAKNYHLELFSQTGQKVKSFEISTDIGSSIVSISVADVPPGLYLLRINAKKQIFSQKIIISK